MLLNVGPSHPAMHGVIQLVVELDGEEIKGVDVEMLARAYVTQPKAKEILSRYFKETGDAVNAGLLEKKQVRVMADRKAVYLAWHGVSVKIDNPALAARVYAAIYPTAGNTQVPANKLLVEAAVVGAIGCMTSDDCWGAIGDGVSAVSEWLNS